MMTRRGLRSRTCTRETNPLILSSSNDEALSYANVVRTADVVRADETSKKVCHRAARDGLANSVKLFLEPVQRQRVGAFGCDDVGHE